MRILLLVISLVAAVSLQAQRSTAVGHLCEKEVVDGDTLAVVNLDLAVIAGSKDGESSCSIRKKHRLEEKVVKVYPYAYTAGLLMKEYETDLMAMDNKSDQRHYLKECESKLKDQFEGELRKMTVSEGIILIKLIDRQTGDTSFELIDELKGSFSAFMWQSVARIFGHNLKDDYDPYGEDWPIERIVREIELGIIPVQLSEYNVASN
ncbi:MAG: DUF4294 domain-containing protein [Flavobacteriales bacterium]|nr:DUF4294 domain-containing protein [Flavobacteriales bacterium]